MFGKNLKYKVLNFFAIILSIFVVLINMPTYSLTENDIKKFEQSKSGIQNKKKVIANELKQAHEEVQMEAKVKTDLESQASSLQKKINSQSNYISDIEIRIAKLEEKIKESNILIDKKIEKLSTLMDKIHIINNSTTLGAVLSTEDFKNFIDKNEIVCFYLECGRKLINKIKDQRELTKKDLILVENEKKSARDATEILQNDRNQLQKLISQSAQSLEELQIDEKEIEKKLKENEIEERRINAAIEKYRKEKKRLEQEAKRKAEISGTKYVQDKKSDSDLTWDWPVKGYKTISSGFGFRWGTFHPAIDIAGQGILGAEVKSPLSGTVVKTNTDGYGGGFGNYVLIDHGGGYIARYAHLSSVSVFPGQSVSRGQTLGRVGSTGFSTGPHLHLQIELNGKAVNPLTLLSPS